MGFLTNLLNPKIAAMYLSLLSQFIMPERGGVLAQSLVLGAVQTGISVDVNALLALTAGSVVAFLGGRPAWMVAQRWLMETVLAGLAVRMATEATALSPKECYSAANPPTRGGPMRRSFQSDVR